MQSATFLFTQVRNLLEIDVELIRNPLIDLAHEFEANDPHAREHFGALAKDQQRRVFEAIWRINGSPDRENFGENRFAAAPNNEVASALYFATTSTMTFKAPEIVEDDRKDPAGPAAVKAGPAAAKKTDDDVDFFDEDKEPAAPGALDELRVLKTKLERVAVFIPVLQAIKDKKDRKEQIQSFFKDQLQIDDKEKRAIYDILGAKQGRSADRVREKGREIFNTDLNALAKAIRARIEQLEQTRDRNSRCDDGCRTRTA